MAEMGWRSATRNLSPVSIMLMVIIWGDGQTFNLSTAFNLPLKAYMVGVHGENF